MASPSSPTVLGGMKKGREGASGGGFLGNLFRRKQQRSWNEGALDGSNSGRRGRRSFFSFRKDGVSHVRCITMFG